MVITVTPDCAIVQLQTDEKIAKEALRRIQEIWALQNPEKSAKQYRLRFQYTDVANLQAFLARDWNKKLVIYQEMPKWLSRYNEWAPSKINGSYMEINTEQLHECEPTQCVEAELQITVKRRLGE